jgi:hypothetical protein
MPRRSLSTSPKKWSFQSWRRQAVPADSLHCSD